MQLVKQHFVNFVNLGEVYYIVARELGTSKANEAVATVKTWPVEFEEVNESIALSAARVKVEHSLAYADAFVVATAIDKRGTIVTGDTEFKGVYPHVLWLR